MPPPPLMGIAPWKKVLCNPSLDFFSSSYTNIKGKMKHFSKKLTKMLNGGSRPPLLPNYSPPCGDHAPPEKTLTMLIALNML